MEAHWPPLVRALTEPARYPHPVEDVMVVETHISYVLLTGAFAYKVKKPLDLGFLDFSSLAKRRHACEEELRINRRTAPDLYLAVWPVTGSPEGPVLNGAGEAFEYVVRMVQFDPRNRADRCLERAELGPEAMRGLGQRVAELHEGAATPPAAADYGSFSQVRAAQEDNLEQLRAELGRLAVSGERFEALARWVTDFLEHHAELFADRRREERVREGHGDLHLANLVMRDGELIPFDAIEFDPALRFIDVMADVGFAWMDLLARERRDLATHFLNAYLERTGDYPGARLLPFYTVYRALVRAKVAVLQAAGVEADEPESASALRDRAERYFRLAEEAARPGGGMLLIARGVTGVGKSRLSGPVLAELGGIRIRSDVERKRLAGLAATSSGAAGVGEGIYGEAMSDRTYDRLLALARPVVAAGFPAFLDASFLSADRRRAARQLAMELGAPFAILALEASEERIRHWIRERARAADNPSDADEAVLDSQLAWQEPLDPVEESLAVRVDTSGEPDIAGIARALVRTARVPRA